MTDRAAAVPPASARAHHNKNLRLQQKQKLENTAFSLPWVTVRQGRVAAMRRKAAMDLTLEL
ncbi:hypothetical protein X755_24785 [Mesorhizobium sp. LNJC405B00]|nr:hypothetical protein X755_24785 [Mesorhizobium sp. LNJC405B00]ESX97320.1 hypothetical protein X754_04075 [Mesorhizobium sp. LNJC403B00]ESY19167.1 hypothetical protein X750_20445 [Mesorhizobium sp. LNJC394B00]ESZ75846.1 hypothetical protein X726_15045 [Mesorhizobium sp. L103C105A0]